MLIAPGRCKLFISVYGIVFQPCDTGGGVISGLSFECVHNLNGYNFDSLLVRKEVEKKRQRCVVLQRIDCQEHVIDFGDNIIIYFTVVKSRNSDYALRASHI